MKITAYLHSRKLPAAVCRDSVCVSRTRQGSSVAPFCALTTATAATKSASATNKLTLKSFKLFKNQVSSNVWKFSRQKHEVWALAKFILLNVKN